MYSVHDVETAKRIAERVNKHLAEGGRLPHQNLVDRVEVRAHSWGVRPTYLGSPETWGIWPRWAYADRPDLGAQFGGPFYPIRDLP